MELTTLQQIITNIKKGSYTKITYQSKLSTNRFNKDKTVTKVVTSIVRLGVSYSNIKEVGEQLALQGATAAGSLPWGKWVEGMNNYIIFHKDNYYLRVTNSKAKNLSQKITYFCDGQEISKDEAMNLTIPSIWKEKNKPLVFDIKIDNVLSIGNN